MNPYQVNLMAQRTRMTYLVVVFIMEKRETSRQATNVPGDIEAVIRDVGVGIRGMG